MRKFLILRPNDERRIFPVGILDYHRDWGQIKSPFRRVDAIDEVTLFMSASGQDNMTQVAEKWGSFYGAGAGNVYPDENLVRLIKGEYADIPGSGRVLDVGFGIGGNLVFLAQAGFEAHGLEVSEESVKAAEELSAQMAVDLHLGLLTSTDLPYPDCHFDMIVSWCAIYYYGQRQLIVDAVQEFHRALRPGGVLLMSVTHPNSFMVRRLSDDLGEGTRRIDRDSHHDNRLGMEIFYDPTSSGWRRILAGFQEVEEGYFEVDLFNADRRDAWRLFLARKATAP